MGKAGRRERKKKYSKEGGGVRGICLANRAELRVNDMAPWCCVGKS